MREDAVKKIVKDKLTKAGAYWFMPATHGYGRSGVPDIVACYKGVFLAFECKGEGGKTTALQERELERIRDAGGTAYVVGPASLHIVDTVLALTDAIQTITKEST
jgi:Holliday junction resolvase